MQNSFYYNNPEFSDVVIKLREGCIYAHKIVLANASPEMRSRVPQPSMAVIHFPLRDTAVIAMISFIYGSDFKIPTVASDWIDTVNLAHSMNIDSMFASLMTNIPSDVNSSEIMALCTSTNHNLLWQLVVGRLLKSDVSDFNSSMIDSVINLSVINYKKLLRVWLNQAAMKSYQWTILILVCHHYCWTNKHILAAYEQFTDFISEVNFAKLNGDGIKIFTSLPLMKDLIAIKALNAIDALSDQDPNPATLPWVARILKVYKCFT